jgi:hypothetical protein
MGVGVLTFNNTSFLLNFHKKKIMEIILNFVNSLAFNFVM